MYTGAAHVTLVWNTALSIPTLPTFFPRRCRSQVYWNTTGLYCAVLTAICTGEHVGMRDCGNGQEKGNARLRLVVDRKILVKPVLLHYNPHPTTRRSQARQTADRRRTTPFKGQRPSLAPLEPLESLPTSPKPLPGIQ